MKKSTRTKITSHYVLLDKGNQIAFISLDLYPIEEKLSLYEIFVPTALRHSGYGGKGIKTVEDFALSQGYKKVVVYAMPFEEDYPQEKLNNWYKKHGFQEGPGNHFEKELH